ncbi:hypothetical protein CLOM_g8248, partial [Closterium sp. NIES-68]
ANTSARRAPTSSTPMATCSKAGTGEAAAGPVAGDGDAAAPGGPAEVAAEMRPSVPHEAAAEDGSDNDGPLAGYILVDSTLPCSPSSALAPAPGAQTTAGQVAPSPSPPTQAVAPDASTWGRPPSMRRLAHRGRRPSAATPPHPPSCPILTLLTHSRGRSHGSH